MRILHLIDSTGPGGAETVFSQLVAALADEPVQSIAVIPRQRNAEEWSELGRSWLPTHLRELGISPVVLPTGGSFDAAHLLRVVRLFRAERVDLVHAHQITASVYASAAGLATRVPVVSTLHGENDFIRGDSARRVKFWLLNRGAARHVFVSGALQQRASTLTTLDPDRSMVIHNGVAIDAGGGRGNGQRAREKLKAGPAELLIGAVGNVRPTKDYHTLIRSVAVLKAEGLTPRCVIVGEHHSELQGELRRLARQLGVDRQVEFIGYRSDVSELLRAFDILAVSSRSEGFSLSTIQGMAAALPVVATRCGGPEEIVTHGHDGLLVPVEQPEAMAAALGRLLRDPAERQRLGQAALKTVRGRFSLEAMVRSYMELYSSVIGA